MSAPSASAATEQGEVPSSRLKEMTIEGSAADVGFTSSMDAAGSGELAIRHGHNAIAVWSAMWMV